MGRVIASLRTCIVGSYRKFNVADIRLKLAKGWMSFGLKTKSTWHACNAKGYQTEQKNKLSYNT